MARALPLAASPQGAFLGADSPFGAGAGTHLFAGDPSFAVVRVATQTFLVFWLGGDYPGCWGTQLGLRAHRVSLGVTGGGGPAASCAGAQEHSPAMQAGAMLPEPGMPTRKTLLPPVVSNKADFSWQPDLEEILLPPQRWR